MTDPHEDTPLSGAEDVMTAVEDMNGEVFAGVAELLGLVAEAFPDGPPDGEVSAAIERITSNAERMREATERMRAATLGARAETN
ncbi:hypothetical protein [Nocardia nova]